MNANVCTPGSKNSIVTNASTCLRLLGADPPDVDPARETARRTIRDGKRAADVMTRLRAMFSEREFTAEPLDLNEATREVIALSMSDLQRHTGRFFSRRLPTICRALPAIVFSSSKSF